MYLINFLQIFWNKKNENNSIDDYDSYVENISYIINKIVDNKTIFENSISESIIYEHVSEENHEKFQSLREVGGIYYKFDLEKINEVEELIDVICEIFLIDIEYKLKKHLATRLFTTIKKNIEESI